MASFQEVIILGNVCADPELRYAANGSAVMNLSVATNKRWKDKTSGDLQERAEFHRLSLFGRLAEVAGEYLHKGDPVFVTGELQTNKWTDKEGVERYTTGIVVNNLQLLGSRKATESTRPHEDRRYAAQTVDFDDEIPF